MYLRYVATEGDIAPAQVDTTSSKNFVYLRRNIREKEIPRIDENTTLRKVYEYEEAKLTHEEYKMYRKIDDIQTNYDLGIVEIAESYDRRLDELETRFDESIVEIGEMINSAR